MSISVFQIPNLEFWSETEISKSYFKNRQTEYDSQILSQTVSRKSIIVRVFCLWAFTMPREIGTAMLSSSKSIIAFNRAWASSNAV